MKRAEFTNTLRVILPMRGEVAEAIQNVESSAQNTQLQLINIIGRKAYNRHSNLFYDFDER